MQTVLRSVSPALLDWIRAYRFRRRCRRLFLPLQNQVAQAIYPDGQIEVIGGPFAGMRYFNEVVWGPIIPKWLGSYEEELHDVIQDALDRQYSVIVDVGAAEGYYAVGLARSLPNTTVVSYDIDPFARKLQNDLARLNGVNNLHIRTRCTHDDLNVLNEGGLLISDIEGYEYELLNPSRSPSLINCDILIEVHSYQDITANQVKDVLLKRFEKTHRIQSLKVTERESSTYDSWNGRLLDQKVLAAALNEHRDMSQEWLWLQANV